MAAINTLTEGIKTEGVKPMSNTRKTAAFTLIELIITVAIIAILASIAYPNYSAHIIKVNRSNIINDILQCAALLERQFTVKHSYNLNACDELKQNSHYARTVTTPNCTINNNNRCFKITAKASSALMIKDDACNTFGYTNLGITTAYKADGTIANKADCWGK